jgi:hypothetical protein
VAILIAIHLKGKIGHEAAAQTYLLDYVWGDEHEWLHDSILAVLQSLPRARDPS